TTLPFPPEPPARRRLRRHRRIPWLGPDPGAGGVDHPHLAGWVGHPDLPGPVAGDAGIALTHSLQHTKFPHGLRPLRPRPRRAMARRPAPFARSAVAAARVMLDSLPRCR